MTRSLFYLLAFCLNTALTVFALYIWFREGAYFDGKKYGSIQPPHPYTIEPDSAAAPAPVHCPAGREHLPEAPAVKEKAQYATLVGKPAGHELLLNTSLLSQVGRPDIDVDINVVGVFPKRGKVDKIYRLLFNADADDKTGRTVASFPGIDKEVLIRVTGVGSASPRSASAVLIDHDTPRGQTPLPAPRLVQSVLYQDYAGRSSNPKPLDEGQIALSLPKAFLNLSAVQVSVAIVAEDAAGTVKESLKMVFDQGAYLREPTVALAPGKAHAGDTVRFSVWGFAPGAVFKLSFDDAPVLTGTVNDAGICNGSFVVPDVPPRNAYYVTANQEHKAGERFRYGFNVLTVLPRH
jgi:hypothetical protein